MSAANIAVPDLTPVERNALLVLMAESRPLKEKADLQRRFGIAMSKKHRESLLRQGLIETTRSPFTHNAARMGMGQCADASGTPQGRKRPRRALRGPRRAWALRKLQRSE